eukprot:2037386-Ditylum_brightwellii.AAC.1
MLDLMVVIELDGKKVTKVEHWCGEIPGWHKALQTWGETGVVKTKSDTMPKLADQGVTSMFVWYVINYKDGVVEVQTLLRW